MVVRVPIIVGMVMWVRHAWFSWVEADCAHVALTEAGNDAGTTQRRWSHYGAINP